MRFVIPYVEFAKERGIVEGYPGGSYRPLLAVNRGQMAVFIARSTASPTDGTSFAEYTPPEHPIFSDVTEDNHWSWCYKHVAYIVSRGVASGYDDGRYHPEGDCSRDQMAVFLTRAFDLAVPEEFPGLPAALVEMKSTHPRLYVTAGQVAKLTTALPQEPYAALFREVRDVADLGVAADPPAYFEPEDWTGWQQLWQRPVGDMIPHLALAYLLTGKAEYLEAARKWMLASAGYPTWGVGSLDGVYLAAGHQLYGLALAYDWLYHDLDAETLATVRNCLATRGQRLYEAVLTEQVWWHDLYLLNQQWVNMTGLAAAGLALFGEVDGVDGWILLSLEKFRTAVDSLGPDGAYHEGVPYWAYSLEHLLKFADLSRTLLDEDLFQDSQWLANTASFRLYSMLPVQSWTRHSIVMNFGDGTRQDYYGPDYLLRKLAAEYGNGHAQWLAQALDEADLSAWAARFLNLLWVDPGVAPKAPDDLPTFRHFEDLGLVFMRSGWDGHESVMGFKCGPHIGHYALERYSYDPGGEHAHPDAGSVLLFAHGDWLLVDDGKTHKTTAFQNTVLVNGVGQEGEGAWGFRGDGLCAENRGARILRADAGEEYDYVIGDATAAYRAEAGLTRYLRHVLYLKPDCWVIVDELEASAPSTFELYFHADFPFQAEGAKAYSVRGPRGSLRLTALAPDDVTGRSWRQQLIGKGKKPSGQTEALKLWNTRPRERTLFITVLEAHPSRGTPDIRPSIARSGGGQTLVLQDRTRTWRLALRPDRPDPAAPILVEVARP